MPRLIESDGRSLTYSYLSDGTKVLALLQNDYLPFGTRVSGYGYATLEDNRYRYAGKEEQRLGNADGQLNLGLLDFGARYYDPSICRWTSVDPLAHKYPGLTPYNYCGGDPINRIDPDGRKIVVEGSKEFRQRVYDSRALLSKHGITVMEDLDSSSNTYIIKEGRRNTYNGGGEERLILWNPTESAYDSNKNIIRSPVIRLVHELGHAIHHDTDEMDFIEKANIGDPSFTTLAEKEVIQGIEQKVARKLGEIQGDQITRDSHMGYIGPQLSGLSVENQSSFCAWKNNPLPVIPSKNIINTLIK